MLEEPRTELDVCLDHDRRMNVIQLIGLCAAIGLAAGGAARYSGFGWGASVLISWVATIVGVFGLTGLIILIETLFERDEPPPLAPRGDPLMDLTEEDRETGAVPPPEERTARAAPKETADAESRR